MSNLCIESIRHSFEGKPVLNCDYTILKSDKVTGIVGINGSGKSTLFKILFGSMKADYSRIQYKGKQITSLFTQSETIAYLSQENFLPISLSIDKFLNISHLNPIKEKIFRDRFKPLLKQKINTLSGGERRVLEIWYIFALEKDFVILDEPFIGLEPKWIEETKVLIRKCNKGIIISSHLYRDLAEELDDTYLLVDGNLKKVESDEDLRLYGYLPAKSKKI